MRGVHVNSEDFVASVRDRGEYQSAAEAQQAATAVLEVLAERITRGEAKDVAAQLPNPFKSAALPRDAEPAESFGVQEFCRRVAERTGAHEQTAEWDASAVLSTVADAVPRGQLTEMLSRLPAGYASLFGKPEPA